VVKRDRAQNGFVLPNKIKVEYFSCAKLIRFDGSGRKSQDSVERFVVSPDARYIELHLKRSFG
jgi:hypothetical protein